MDWGRAKTILILSFLSLNLILGYQLWKNNSKQTELAADTSDMIEETNKLLRSKHIQIVQVLPKEVPKLKEIVALNADESLKKSSKIELKSPLKINSILNKVTGKESPIRMKIPRMDLYQFDPVNSEGNMYVFNQMYAQLPMFEVKLELYEQNGEITSYRQAYVEVESGGEQKEQKVIPAYIAIRSLVENYLLDGSVISDIRLGYHGQTFNSQTQPMFPSWRVAIGNGDLYYVHAFNGAVERVEKVEKDVTPSSTSNTKVDKTK